MARPVLIDTDMGVDDALAICLALASSRIDLRAVVSVGGNVDSEQATRNVGRLLDAVRADPRPRIGRGLDQQGADNLLDARWLFGRDGLGETDLPEPSSPPEPDDSLDVYARTIDECAGELTVVAIGPLTNLSALLLKDPDRFARIKELVIMGGAVFVSGNVENVAEFNFYRDPVAARDVLHSGHTITLVPLDATQNVVLDESHLGHFGASDTVYGPLLARVMSFPMRHARDAEKGRFIIHDAIAVGALIWPELFMHTRLVIDVDVSGNPPGKSSPARNQDKSRLVSMILSVNQDAYLERLIDVLCRERFHV